ncbi:MAG: hypothetical protein AAFR61_19800 [Bacteroidota bacterium]
MKYLFTILLCWVFILPTQAQSDRPLKVAVLTLDAKGLDADPLSLGNLARVELQKIGEFEVIDRYDMEELLAPAEIDFQHCYSKTCLVKAGEILEADKMLTGNLERFGEKIMIILRLIDVKDRSIEKTIVNEYVNYEQEVQKMLEMSINNIFSRTNDPALVHGLTYTSSVISVQPAKQLNNGPRVGMAYVFGQTADRLTAPRSQGGYDIYPVISQVGYQHEFQYLSSGNFQALIEVLGMVSGMEQSLFIPNVVLMNGFRHKKSGFEIAFGPSIGARKMAEGYFVENEGVKTWHLRHEWNEVDENLDPIPNPNEIEEQIDSRGDMTVFSRWIWAAGITFRSGNLNIPVNIYASPLRRDVQVGISVGFNVQKYRTSQRATPNPGN